MTSLSGHEDNTAHKNGTTEQKSENSKAVNSREIMADALVDETANIKKTVEKTETAKEYKASDDVLETTVAPEKITASPQNDQVSAPSAISDPGPPEPENNALIKEPYAENMSTVPNEPRIQEAIQSETDQLASAKVDDNVDTNSADGDDELTQIRKELASSEPTKVSETGSAGNTEGRDTDETLFEEAAPPAKQDEAAPPASQQGEEAAPPASQQGEEAAPPTSQGKEATRPVSQGEEAAPPSSQGEEATPPTSHGEEADVPASQGEEAAPPTSQGEDAAPPASHGEEAAPPASQGEDAAPPASHGEEAAPPVSHGEEAAPPTNQGEDAAPPAGQGEDAAPPASHGEEAAVPASQGEEAAPPASHGEEAAVPASQGEEAAPPTSQEEAAPPDNQGEEATKKEQANDLVAIEPMQVDGKHEEKLNNKNGKIETQADNIEKVSVANLRSLPEVIETGKDKMDRSAMDYLKEENSNSRTESCDSDRQKAVTDRKLSQCTADLGITADKTGSKDDNEKPEPGKEDNSDVAKRSDVSALSASDTHSPANADKKDASSSKDNEDLADKYRKESEEEEEDDKERVPLLEQPPETSGRRARKAVERFSEGASPEARRSSLPLEQGRGARLADCPVVNGNIGSGPPEQVHALHQAVFGRPGRPHEFRRNLRRFSGFAFRPDGAGYTKKRDSLLRYRVDALRSLSHLLNLETKSKSRDELAQGVLDFLMEPTPTDTVVESSKNRKGARSSSRRSAASEEQEEEEEEEEQESVKKTPSRKTPSKRTPAKRTPAKKTPAKQTPIKKTPAKRTSARKPPAKRTPVKSAGRKTPARQASKRKRMQEDSDSEEEEEEEAAMTPPTSKRAKTGRAPPRARR